MVVKTTGKLMMPNNALSAQRLILSVWKILRSAWTPAIKEFTRLSFSRKPKILAAIVQHHALDVLTKRLSALPVIRHPLLFWETSTKINALRPAHPVLLPLLVNVNPVYPHVQHVKVLLTSVLLAIRQMAVLLNLIPHAMLIAHSTMLMTL